MLAFSQEVTFDVVWLDILKLLENYDLASLWTGFDYNCCDVCDCTVTNSLSNVLIKTAHHFLYYLSSNLLFLSVCLVLLNIFHLFYFVSFITPEQKIAPAPTVQPIQGHPVGRSFSPPPSYSPHSQTSTHIKHSPAKLPEQKREDSAVRRREKITSVHTGIDSEDGAVLMSPDSESLQREGNSDCNEEKRDESKKDNSQTIPTFDCDKVTSTLIDRDQCNLLLSAENSLQRSEVDEDLKRENAALRSELHDIREELHKRLDDLDAQRRAEAEARTRLKQLSRKLGSQSVEKGEQEKEWRLQLEREKAETEKLRKAMAALEMENEKGRDTREENERQEAQEEEKYKALEDRESEMIELNIQLKKQLAEVKAQLALEREEKKMSQINTDIDEKNTLIMKIEELMAELEELKLSRKDSLEEKLSVSTSPLLYLTLRDDELNSNKLPSPEQHLLFCQSTNQRNTLVTQATSQLIQEQEMVIDAEPVPRVASDIPAARQDCPVEFSLSDDREVQKDVHVPSDLEKVVEHLQKKLVKESENANQYQLKLEALQGQVHNVVHITYILLYAFVIMYIMLDLHIKAITLSALRKIIFICVCEKCYLLN